MLTDNIHFFAFNKVLLWLTKMPTDVETLMEMGFSENRSAKALSKTGYKGVQQAMDWLFAHEDDPDIDEPFEAPKGQTLGSAGSSQSTDGEAGAAAADAAGADDATQSTQEQAASLKCDDCGKLLRNADEAELHAARTKHANFSESTEEIKPLTAEEKAARLADLQQRMQVRRAEREQKEKDEQIQREKTRRIQSKEIAEAKQKMKEDEIKKMVAERKREKEEERLARQRVREQIEKDKKDRAAKFAKDPQPATPTAAQPSQPAAAAAPKEYDQSRIQVRLTNGQALTQSFGVKEPLSAVRLFVQLQAPDLSYPFTLMTSFPRKVFTEADMEKPLNELGLVPTAVLMVTKAS